MIAKTWGDEPRVTDAPLVMRRVEIAGPKSLDKKEISIDVGALVRGLPTELRIALPAEKLPSPDSFVLVKTCSCFSAGLMVPMPTEDTGRQDNEWIGLSIITVPKGQFLRETIYVYPKDDDSEKDVSKRDPKEALFVFEIAGTVLPLVDVRFSSDRIPWGDEKLAITVGVRDSDFRIEPSSIQVEVPTLKLEGPEIKPDGRMVYYVSRFPREERVPGDGLDDRVLSSVGIRCRVVLADNNQASVHFEDTYRLWDADSVRMIPNRILLEADELKDVLWLSIIDLSGESAAKEEFPYQLRYVKKGGGEEAVDLLPENIQRVSESRWKIGFVPPSLDTEVKGVMFLLYKKQQTDNQRNLASTHLILVQ